EIMSVTTCAPNNLKNAAQTTPAESTAGGASPASRRRIFRTIGVAVAFSALIAVGVYGHLHDWKLPAFSSLGGGGAPEEDNWCDAHGVPESQCMECNLKEFPRDKDYGWCQEHGVAQCPLHHPDVAQLQATPAVSAGDFERANRALTLMARPDNNSRCKLH